MREEKPTKSVSAWLFLIGSLERETALGRKR